MEVSWGPNWDEGLAGGPDTAAQDPLLAGMTEQVRMTYEQAFMFFLPRICEHCLNPSCVASCPSGAMYKREEDGIVLVDQERCRGWRFCVSGCPYKKVYFNHRTGKAEKCTMCYPRIEAGQPTICSETCVGRIRYLGLVLYDADRIEEAASVADERALLDSQVGLFLDPHDPHVHEAARRDGIPDDWLEHARRSPVYDLAVRWRVALPLHPEFRTMPMVWYVPPLSPIVATLETDGYEADPDDVFGAIDHMRIPLEYLANLLSAGDPEVIRRVLHRLAAMRAYMRKREVLGETDEGVAARAGLEPAELERMYRLLAIADYEDRYVIPQAHAEQGAELMREQGTCGLDFEGGPGNCGAVESRPQTSSPVVPPAEDSGFDLVQILRKRGSG
jgi:nitrate reductase beta subunit